MQPVLTKPKGQRRFPSDLDRSRIPSGSNELAASRNGWGGEVTTLDPRGEMGRDNCGVIRASSAKHTRGPMS